MVLLAASSWDVVKGGGADADDAGCWSLTFDWLRQLMLMMLAVLCGKSGQLMVLLAASCWDVVKGRLS